MADRRMFTQKIIDSDAFLEMPLSAQCLYFHLNMRADDDGFVNNPKKIQRVIGASEDDLKLLLAKRFILGFDSGIIVIKHWRMHNLIRKDRYHPSMYQDELRLLELKDNGSYTEIGEESDIECQVIGNQLATNGKPNDNQVTTKGKPIGNQLATEVRLGKVSIDNIYNNRSNLEQEFDQLWQIYPRKQGKKKAFEAYKRARRDKVEYYDVLKGINAYVEYIKINRIAPEYIKQGSTFFSQQAWQDDWTPKRGASGVILADVEEDDGLDGIL